MRQCLFLLLCVTMGVMQVMPLNTVCTPGRLPAKRKAQEATLRGQSQRLSRGMRGTQFADDLSAWLSVFDVAKLRFLVEKG